LKYFSFTRTIQKSLFLIIFLASLKVSSQTLLINEFEAKNASTIKDNADDYDDWIEIYNTTSSSINLNGYCITDDLKNKTKFQLTTAGSELVVPAGGYLLLWADGETSQGKTHLSFKLSGDKGEIGLVNSSAQWVDSLTYSLQYSDISKGRDKNNKSAWKYYSTPTPGSANNTSAYAGVSGKPVFSNLSGVYGSSIPVSLTPTSASDTIRYTLNNSDPKSTSTIYKTPININKTQVIRAIAKGPGKIGSEITSQIYFRNVNHTLPILAIITDTLNLFGSKGIYTNYDQSGRDWERFCQIKYIKNGVESTESNAGIRIQGSSSIGMPKKSFRLFFRDEYGNGKFDYPIYGVGKIDKFDKLVLKSGYDDDITTDNGTLLRDAITVEFWNKIGGFPQINSWAVLYLNQHYWGIYNIRESVDETFIQDHTSMNDFDLVRFHNEGSECKYGTITDWNELYNFIKTKDLSVQANYETVASLLDIDDFTTLMAMVQCSQYYSWCWGVSMFKNNDPAGKWKFSIWDADRAYLSKVDINWNGFNEAENSTTDLFWANNFPKKLCDNAEFRRLYVNRICDLLNSVFLPDSAIKVLDSNYNLIKPEIQSEFNSWNPGVNDWEANVERIREYFRDRPNGLISQMKDYFSLSTMHTIDINVTGHGRVKVNQLLLGQYPWQGNYFENNAVDLYAIPDSGYHFAGWDKVEENPEMSKSVNLTNDLAITAYFEVGPDAVSTPEKEIIQLQVYPNPFDEKTTINYIAESNETINLSVYTIDGKPIKNIFTGKVTVGEHNFSWNGDGLNENPVQTGMYLVRLQTGNTTQFYKIIKAK
jgi:hypothetical protein